MRKFLQILGMLLIVILVLGAVFAILVKTTSIFNDYLPDSWKTVVDDTDKVTDDITDNNSLSNGYPLFVGKTLTVSSDEYGDIVLKDFVSFEASTGEGGGDYFMLVVKNGTVTLDLTDYFKYCTELILKLPGYDVSDPIKYTKGTLDYNGLKLTSQEAVVTISNIKDEVWYGSIEYNPNLDTEAKMLEYDKHITYAKTGYVATFENGDEVKTIYIQVNLLDKKGRFITKSMIEDMVK